jgi:hypothetical protein
LEPAEKPERIPLALTWDDYGVVIKAAIACAVIALTGEVLIACTRRKSN